MQHCFSANRPGWVDQVRQGDIIVGGFNFGTGSSRPDAHVFKRLGISCLLAETINGLFLRNCVNYGLAALPFPGILQAFEEGEEAEVDLRSGRVTNLSRDCAVRVAFAWATGRYYRGGGSDGGVEEGGVFRVQAPLTPDARSTYLGHTLVSSPLTAGFRLRIFDILAIL